MALTLGLVFGLRLRQSEGFLSSVLALMGLDLRMVPVTYYRHPGHPAHLHVIREIRFRFSCGQIFDLISSFAPRGTIGSHFRYWRL